MNMLQRRTTTALITAGITTAGLLVVGGASARADVAGQPREAVVSQYQSILLPTLSVPADWTGSTQTCAAGTTSEAYQAATLTAINYMRGLVAQPAVSLDPALNAYAQSAALIMAAQGGLDHHPPTSWACWSPEGYDGAGHSNLSLGNAGPNAIVAYMKDAGSNNLLAGHRRWVVNSQGSVMGTGDTSRTNALLVFGAGGRSSNGAWIPWPASGYFPWQLEPSGRWSLGLPGGNFDAASVSVSIAGTPIPVNVTPPRYGYGDNTITWDMSLPTPSRRYHPEDVNVDVHVAGIRLGDGRTVDYAYTVNLVDAAPHTPPAATSFTDVRRTPGGILATWAPTTNDGGETVTYVVTATPLGKKAAKKYPVRTCTTADTTCLITKVSRLANYKVSLIARNALGDSATDVETSPKPRR